CPTAKDHAESQIDEQCDSSEPLQVHGEFSLASQLLAFHLLVQVLVLVLDLPYLGVGSEQLFFQIALKSESLLRCRLGFFDALLEIGYVLLPGGKQRFVLAELLFLSGQHFLQAQDAAVQGNDLLDKRPMMGHEASPVVDNV